MRLCWSVIKILKPIDFITSASIMNDQKNNIKVLKLVLTIFILAVTLVDKSKLMSLVAQRLELWALD